MMKRLKRYFHMILTDLILITVLCNHDEDTPDYLDSIKELIEEGITSLVIDLRPYRKTKYQWRC